MAAKKRPQRGVNKGGAKNRPRPNKAAAKKKGGKNTKGSRKKLR